MILHWLKDTEYYRHLVVEQNDAIKSNRSMILRIQFHWRIDYFCVCIGCTKTSWKYLRITAIWNWCCRNANMWGRGWERESLKWRARKNSRWIFQIRRRGRLPNAWSTPMWVARRGKVLDTWIWTLKTRKTSFNKIQKCHHQEMLVNKFSHNIQCTKLFVKILINKTKAFRIHFSLQNWLNTVGLFDKKAILWDFLTKGLRMKFEF